MRCAATVGLLLLCSSLAAAASPPELVRDGAPASPEPAPAESDFAAAEAAAAAKDYATALPRFEAAIAADPESRRDASEYRMAIIAAAALPSPGAAAYDRAIAFFERTSAAHPRSANLLLNWGYAYVDKIPTAGSITQVILANTAQRLFTRSLDLERSWLALYTRGNSYLYWPKVFGRAPLAIADLEEALRLSRAGPPRPYFVRAYLALGDGYWKLDQLDRARATWSDGARLFPDDARLKLRLAKQGDELRAAIEADLDPNKRVDTDLRSIWADRP